MTNEGNLADPFTSLKEALENPRMSDGQTIYLKAGTHYITENVTIAANNITIRPYQNDVVKIAFDPVANSPCFLLINGDNIQFLNMEIASEPTNREAPARGNHTGVQLGWIGVSGSPPSTGLFRNCIIHDMASCTWYGEADAGATIYQDCILYNFGWPVTGGLVDGEYWYSQNAASYPVKHLRNCIIGPCFSVSLQIYGQALAPDGSARASNYNFENLIFYRSSPYIISSGIMDGMSMTGCVAWYGDMIWGDTATSEQFYEFLDNWWVSGIAANDDPQFGTWLETDVQNNRFVTINPAGRYFYHPATDATWGAAVERVWDNNEYYGTAAASITFPNGQTLAQWKSNTGYDANSTHSESLPATNWVKVHPCSLAPKVAHIAIFNWEELDNPEIDVSALNLTARSYRLRNAFDPMTDYTDFTHDGSGTIVLPMAARTIATPEAYGSPLATLDIRFGAFSLEQI